MGRWPRRVAFLSISLLWLLLMTLPLLAFVLAARGQMQLGAEDGNHVRVFLISEQTEEGIGLEWSRASAAASGCLQTSVRFFMWRGASHRISFCSCSDAVSSAMTVGEGTCGAPSD